MLAWMPVAQVVGLAVFGRNLTHHHRSRHLPLRRVSLAAPKPPCRVPFEMHAPSLRAREGGESSPVGAREIRSCLQIGGVSSCPVELMHPTGGRGQTAPLRSSGRTTPLPHPAQRVRHRAEFELMALASASALRLLDPSTSSMKGVPAPFACPVGPRRIRGHDRRTRSKTDARRR
jgi:hypothetical protein